ncbi:MAG: hypothetical protein Ct9H90mP18_06800 [Gammaproteobacteria bacterium]|nr:MAG: hypothetical protein Ct9H90mP18_06800 [Gammaproteobacteria bacterium]
MVEEDMGEAIILDIQDIGLLIKDVIIHPNTLINNF